jgi:hypothetical protein
MFTGVPADIYRLRSIVPRDRSFGHPEQGQVEHLVKE